MLADFLAPPSNHGRIAEGYIKACDSLSCSGTRDTSPDSSSLPSDCVRSSLSIRTDCGEDWPPQGNFVIRSTLVDSAPERHCGYDGYFQECDSLSCSGTRVGSVRESWASQGDESAMPSIPPTPQRWPATPSEDCLSTSGRVANIHSLSAEVWDPHFTVHRMPASPRPPHLAPNTYSRPTTLLPPQGHHSSRTLLVPPPPAPPMPPVVSTAWMPPPPPSHAPIVPATVEAPPPLHQALDEVVARADKPPNAVLGSPSLPTVGSANHGTGTCKPCAFVYKKGCVNGTNCTFCHLCGPQEKKRRQKEKKAMLRELHRQDSEV